MNSENAENKIQEYKREASYGTYQIDLEKVYYHKIIKAVNTLSRDTRGKLLDIACWDGALAAQFLPEREVYGLEGNLSACEKAKGRGIHAQAVDLEKGLPFSDATFDCVIAAEIIEHLYDTDFFLREIHRILQPNGLVVMSIPNIACFSNRLALLFGKYPRYAEYRAGGAGHIRVYTAPILKSQLIENGFEVKYYAGCNLPMPMHSTFIPKWVKRLAAAIGEYFPNISGQTIIAAYKRSGQKTGNA